MMNYQDNPQFSFKRSQKRMVKAKRILGQALVNKIIAFALYLLGANIQSLATFLKMPRDTVKSLIDRIDQEGLPAFEDRRHKNKSSTVNSNHQTQITQTTQTIEAELLVEPENITIHFNDNLRIKIPRVNKFQCRTVLLTMLDASFFKKELVADVLQLSAERTRKLKAALYKNDVHALIDKRCGQKIEYRMTSEAKAELLQQYVLNLSRETNTSSEQLKNDLNKRCKINLSSRTIRLYVDRMGLKHLKHSLPVLLRMEKKT